MYHHVVYNHFLYHNTTKNCKKVSTWKWFLPSYYFPKIYFEKYIHVQAILSYFYAYLLNPYGYYQKKVYISSITLLSFFEENYHQNKLLRNLFLCCFANTYYAEKIDTSSIREYLFLKQNAVRALPLQRSFIDLTFIIPIKYTLD